MFDIEGWISNILLQVAVAGAALGWLKDNIGMIENAKKSQEIAEKATDNGSVVFVPAFSGLYAPYWRQDARGYTLFLCERITH